MVTGNIKIGGNYEEKLVLPGKVWVAKK